MSSGCSCPGRERSDEPRAAGPAARTLRCRVGRRRPTAQYRLMIDLATRLFGPWVRAVDARTLRADFSAGILGALLVLPQGFAFATLAGLPPQYGLYTAIVPCAIAALFGSSLHVVSGPTNANSLALFATLAPLAVVGSPRYIQLALAVTVIVGSMQFL